ncbi:SOS response-associated peptidase [Rothia sp. LK2588]|uniref:SOS response-associated peptidase n=1 Tax=Rothia sp. LK2588 TaxID=3114369 RepID=UPI0034CDEEE5
MCGRYVLEFDHDLYVGDRKVGTDIYNYNVAPTATVPILVDRLEGDAGNFTREMHAARWGLLPTWAKDATFSAKAFNARSETIFEKPTFRAAATSGHCAIPVTGYYEWKTHTTAGGKTTKTPHFIYRADGQPIYFAGLYSWWKITEAEAQREKSAYPDQAGQWLLSCSIITMDAPDELDVADLAAAGHDETTTAQLSQLHDRLPLPLSFTGSPDDDITLWLRSGKPAGTPGEKPTGHDTVNARNALATITEHAYAQTPHWRMHPVSTDVGNVRNNAHHLIEPVEDLFSELPAH